MNRIILFALPLANSFALGQNRLTKENNRDIAKRLFA